MSGTKTGLRIMASTCAVVAEYYLSYAEGTDVAQDGIQQPRQLYVTNWSVEDGTLALVG